MTTRASTLLSASYTRLKSCEWAVKVCEVETRSMSPRRFATDLDDALAEFLAYRLAHVAELGEPAAVEAAGRAWAHEHAKRAAAPTLVSLDF